MGSDYRREKNKGKSLETINWPFDLQFPFVAVETDAVDSLHGGRQVGQHVWVCGQLWEAEGGQRREAAAQRALDGVGLGRLDVDACQTLQAEGVFALKHLGTAEDVVELAEADGALQVRVLRGLRGDRRQAEVWGRDDDGHLAGGGGGGVRVQRGDRNLSLVWDWKRRGGAVRAGWLDQVLTTILLWWGLINWGVMAQNCQRAMTCVDDWRRGGWQRWIMGIIKFRGWIWRWTL